MKLRAVDSLRAVGSILPFCWARSLFSTFSACELVFHILRVSGKLCCLFWIYGIGYGTYVL